MTVCVPQCPYVSTLICVRLCQWPSEVMPAVILDLRAMARDVLSSRHFFEALALCSEQLDGATHQSVVAELVFAVIVEVAVAVVVVVAVAVIVVVAVAGVVVVVVAVAFDAVAAAVAAVAAAAVAAVVVAVVVAVVAVVGLLVVKMQL